MLDIVLSSVFFMFWLSILSIVVLFIRVCLAKVKMNKNREVYLIIMLIVFWVFMLRLACNHPDCIFDIIMPSDWTSYSQSCVECENKSKQDIDSLTLKLYLKIDSDCKKCTQSKADWSLRTGFDATGLSLVTLYTLVCILFLKNIPLDEITIDSFNFGGILFKLKQDEKAIEELNQEISDQIEDIGIREEANRINDNAANRSNHPYDELYILVEEIERLHNKIDKLTSQRDILTSPNTNKQIKKLQEVYESFLNHFKNDKINKYVNMAIGIARKIVIAYVAITDNVRKTPKFSAPKYRLKNSLGVKSFSSENDITGYYSEILKKHTPIPSYFELSNYKTLSDYQPEILFEIYHTKLTDNEHNKIDEIRATGLPRKVKGEVKVTIYCKVDKQSILLIKVYIQDTNELVGEGEFKVNEHIEKIEQNNED